MLIDTSSQLLFITCSRHDAGDGAPLLNPAWARLNPNGIINLQVKFTTDSCEDPVLTPIVAKSARQESITRVAKR